ncbi:hypothetical protein MMC25_006400 [Agyrium rufum]|nr:hypothetical protein [Agyrium rufum]
MDVGNPSSLIAISVVLPTLGLLAVGLRFYARSQQTAKLMLDDWLTVPAVFLVVVQGVTLIVGTVGHGLAYSTPPPGPEGLFLSNSPQKILAQKAEYVATISFVMELLFVKLSLVLFFHRIFSTGQNRVFDVFTKGLAAFVVAWGLAFFFAFTFNCKARVALQWADLLDYDTYCDNGLLLEEAYVISDFVLDVILFIVPFPLMWRLHLNLQRKVAITFIITLGTLAVITSIIRLVIIVSVVTGVELSILTKDGDLLTSQVLWWAMLEGGVAVIIICLPTLQFLLRKSGPYTSLTAFFSLLTLRSTQTGKTTQKDGGAGGGACRQRIFRKGASDPPSPASSHIGFAKTDEQAYKMQSVNMYAMVNIEAQKPEIDTPLQVGGGQILVRSEISHLRS